MLGKADQAQAGAPGRIHELEHEFELLRRRHQGAELRKAAVEHQGGGPFRIGGGEQHAHRTTFGHADDGGPLGPYGVEDGPYIVHPLLEGGHLWHPVREPGAALVEQDQAGKGG
jgi:hypothetical protein